MIDSGLWETHYRARSVTCHMGSHSVTCHPTQVPTYYAAIFIDQCHLNLISDHTTAAASAVVICVLIYFSSFRFSEIIFCSFFVFVNENYSAQPLLLL